LTLHPLLRGFLRDRLFILVYGEAGTGKTRLAYAYYREALASGAQARLIATEPGTVAFLESLGEDYVWAGSLDAMVEEATAAALNNMLVVVDSVNYYYRGEEWPQGARLLAYSSAILREAGGLATAQVTGSGDAPSGARYMIPWAHVVARTRRSRDSFILEVERPVERILAFRVKGADIEWL